ncbi:MAG TPA: diguanylate cyclase [Thermomicrobiaceae bacterium]|nr:diguanylate cyclase [Thermomicrobiaceae bacterium]
MRELTPGSRRFLTLCYLVGTAAWIWLTLGEPGRLTTRAVLLAGMLTAAAVASQFFSVDRANTDYADHVTPAPLFAAVLLLPSEILPLVVIATFLPRWARERGRWYLHSFDMAAWLTAAALARGTLLLAVGRALLAPGTSLPAVDVALAMVVFLVGRTLLLATALWLARGQAFVATGLFAPGKLLADVALLCTGWAFAAATVVNLGYAPAAAVPLLVIFQALHVPSLRAQAATDPKTGLANMRHFNAELIHELERAGRTAATAALLLCDLDFLRNINNTYGHQAGDIVLNGVADVIRRATRDRDLAGRFGGEEFVILLVDVNRAEARYAAERLRRALEQTAFHIGPGREPVRATMSVGLAMYPVDGHTPEALLREADLALYKAKRDGRNRVVVAGRASRELLGEWQREYFVREPGEHETPPPRFELAPADSARDATPLPVVGDGPAGTADLYGGRLAGIVAAVLVAPALVGALASLDGLGSAPGLWLAPAIFAALAVLAEQFPLDLDEEHRVSLAPIATLAATFGFGVPGALACAVAVVARDAVVRRRAPFGAVLEFGATLLGLTVAARAFATVLPGPLTADGFSAALPVAAAIGLLGYGIRDTLVATGRGLIERGRPGTIWWAEYRLTWPLSGLFGGFAFLVATSRLVFGWAALPVLLLPVALGLLLLTRSRRRARRHLNELSRVGEQLSDSYETTLHALSLALDNRDAETGAHSWRVRRLTELLARHYGLDATQVEQLGRGALLHDIGTIGVPDAILRKPERLTDEETVVLRRHPTIGFSMIAHIPFLAQAAEVVLHHHEAFDGSGYPSGLAGELIPFGARLFAVADAFDAMTSARPYRRAMTDDEARAEIARCRGTQFDPQVVDAFLAISPAELRACRDEAGDLHATVAGWVEAPDDVLTPVVPAGQELRSA